MLNKAIKRTVSDLQSLVATLPPAFLLPLRARLSTITTSNDPEPPSASLEKSGIYNHQFNKPTPSPLRTNSVFSVQTSPPQPFQTPKPPSPTLTSLLPLLRSQPPHYITAHIHARPYLLTAGDTLRLPFKMPEVLPGDVLRLTRASSIGSRDYTLRGAPYVDEKLFECRATVLGTESEPMRLIEKTKRRQRRVKTVKSKHRFTILKVKEVRVKGLEGDDGQGVGNVKGDIIINAEERTMVDVGMDISGNMQGDVREDGSESERR